MTTATGAIALVITLAIVVAILNKKSIDRHNTNASSITEARFALNKRCDILTEDIAAKDKATKAGLVSLRQNANENAKRAEAAEEILSKRIDALREMVDAAISEAKQEAADEAEATYTRAAQHADQKAEGAIKYAEELRDDLVMQLEGRIGAMADLLDSLNKEIAQLQKDLDEQRTKLNFYAGIEEAAEKLTVTEDVDERKRALEAVKQQFLSRKKSPTGSADNINEGEKSESGRQGGARPLPSGTVPGRDQVTPEKEEGVEEGPEGKILDHEQEYKLDHEQKFARDYMENTKENVFVTGKAGTGKSFLLDAFRDITSKTSIVLAPTGIAALHIKGATLHSAFGFKNLVNLDVDDITEETIRLKSEKRYVLKRVNAIIIDEISMVRADTFDKIDRILKAINRSDLPFGGKQMLVFGDLFQLPPVTRGKEHEYLLDKYGGVFFFHSDAYKAGNFKFIELTQNHRQKGDEAYFGILNRIREGEATDKDIDLLNTRYTPEESKYDRYLTLFPTKAEAEQVNRTRMSQLPTAEYVYKARTILDKSLNKNKSIESVFPVNEELRLRKGANVMMVANDPEGRWVNGSVGIVNELSEDRITVSFGKDKTYEVQPTEFDEQEIAYADGKITYEKVFSVMQYPIVPAYAITIHKSQGQTYGNVMCDIERCFDSGQAYVALSRCESLEGLHLKSLVSPASIKVDHEVLDFYRRQSADGLLR